jgi:hypothetical protein
MEKLSIVEEADYAKTLQDAKDTIEKLDKSLSSVNITTKSEEVKEAVRKIFGYLPDANGKITITYEMYSRVIQMMSEAGKHKSQEFS